MLCLRWQFMQSLTGSCTYHAGFCPVCSISAEFASTNPPSNPAPPNGGTPSKKNVRTRRRSISSQLKTIAARQTSNTHPRCIGVLRNKPTPYFLEPRIFSELPAGEAHAPAFTRCCPCSWAASLSGRQLIVDIRQITLYRFCHSRRNRAAL